MICSAPCFKTWVAGPREDDADIVAIDGKSSRRAHGADGRALHLVSISSSAAAVGAEKQPEIAAQGGRDVFRGPMMRRNACGPCPASRRGRATCMDGAPLVHRTDHRQRIGLGASRYRRLQIRTGSLCLAGFDAATSFHRWQGKAGAHLEDGQPLPCLTPASNRSVTERVPSHRRCASGATIGTRAPADFIRARRRRAATRTPYTWPRLTRCQTRTRPLPRGSHPYAVRATLSRLSR